MPMLKEVAVELTDTFFLYDFFERPGLFVCRNSSLFYCPLLTLSLSPLILCALLYALLTRRLVLVYSLEMGEAQNAQHK